MKRVIIFGEIVLNWILQGKSNWIISKVKKTSV